MYLSPPVGTIHASVWDMTSSNTLPSGIQSGTVDIVVLVFVMSALHPDEWGTAIANIYKVRPLHKASCSGHLNHMLV
jgi:tRNAThr (cytosine32-N3)-methyltransferase